MADSSDMAESEEDDIISVTRVVDDIDSKPLKVLRDKKVHEKEKENNMKERVKEKDWDREREKDRLPEKDREQDEWDRFIQTDGDKYSMNSSSRSASTKLKRNNMLV